MSAGLTAAALPNYECSAFYSFSDVSTSVPNRVLPARRTLYGGTSIFVQHTCKRTSHDFKSAVEKWKIHSVNQLQGAVLEDEEKKTWEECKEILSTLNFSPEEADLILRRAFGWIHTPYWGEERQKVVPKNETISEMLDYLKSIGLSDEDLYKLLKKFPEVLGCNLSNEVKMNVATLEREWGIKAKTLRSLLLRNPKVLGYSVDCKGDCIAMCTRCWARF